MDEWRELVRSAARLANWAATVAVTIFGAYVGIKIAARFYPLSGPRASDEATDELMRGRLCVGLVCGGIAAFAALEFGRWLVRRWFRT